MSAKDHSAWDTLPERLRRPAAEFDGPWDGPPTAQLAIERVALVETPPTPDLLRAELAARAAGWTAGDPAESRRASRVLFATLAGVTAVMALGLLTLAMTTSPLLAAPILLLWAPLGYLGWRRLSMRRTVTQRAASRRCPDCGFDLAGAPPGLDAEAFGIDVGPRWCPECGAWWPLVPPPGRADH